ncbi:agmatine deiminase [Flammeovirga kamogawensis]|uniref:Putative agmatine deiminase n=1 Tax=Flammeovirga kamogawensis TaxID=373891 RepID=A0ABX8H2T2_9BACT|nr:agmatine deiminase [Flammeovirga kamogawensis]MBB6460419.1 agmatine deiminase [Flammeovirga kamogawensis]QWG10224.1 agmatine deiminase [Flammeovirga kamogawensis]TRX64675.1 agmatine deiminase [Flammeovirga kamogawensis]
MSQLLNTTPKQDGYYMLAEWTMHTRTWMHWPERTDTWRLGAKPGQEAYVRVAKAIAEFEPVTVCASNTQFENASAMLSHPNIRVIELTQDDAWMRDSGPTFLVNGKGGLRGVDWKFNAYGGTFNGLYSPFDHDDQVAHKVLSIENADRYRTEKFVTEGGSIHTDGEGTVMIVEEVFMNPGRNPGLSREEMEEYLKEYLNVEKVLWVPRGIYNDETPGHIDNMAFFIRPAEVVLAWTDDENDPQYDRSLEAYNYLSTTTDAKGRKITVHKLPVPSPMLTSLEDIEGIDVSETAKNRQKGDRLAGSYINCLICNGGIILPKYGDDNDDVAAKILQDLMPDHRVVQVDAREILLGGGNIHCITQQQPKV